MRSHNNFLCGDQWLPNRRLTSLNNVGFTSYLLSCYFYVVKTSPKLIKLFTVLKFIKDVMRRKKELVELAHS